MDAIVRRWKFRVEDPDGEGCYVGPDGKQDSECEWIGTAAEASAEAQRRADAWENATNGMCLRVVYESRGQVKANAPRQPEPVGDRLNVDVGTPNQKGGEG